MGSSSRDNRTGGSNSRQPSSKSVPIAPGYNRPSPIESPIPSTSGPSIPPDNNEPSILNALRSTDPEVQLANYATQMLSANEFRHWTVSILISDDKLTLWYYDRSSAYCTAPVFFKDDHELFIKIISALALCSKDRKKLGYSELYKRSLGAGDADQSSGDYRYLDASNFTLVHEKDGPIGNEIPDVGLDGSLKILRFSITDMIHKQFTLFGRATRVEDVQVGMERNGEFISTPSNDEFVLKVSYQVSSRILEPHVIEKVRAVDPEHAPAVLGYLVVETGFPGDRLEQVKDERIKKPTKDAHEKRRLVFILIRKYANVWELNAEQFMDVFRQGVLCKQILGGVT